MSSESPDRSASGQAANQAAAGVRGALAAIDAGEVEATSSERAYLAGAADAFEQVTGMERPESDGE